MKKYRFLKTLPVFAIFAMITSGIHFQSHAQKKTAVVEPDNTVYENAEVVELNSFAANTLPAPEVEVSSVTIHYHNDDGKCLTRAFYLWNTGSSSGVEFNPDHATETDMDYTLDFNASEFGQTFKGKKKMMFIIKYKKEPGKPNWDGQSDDVELDFTKFPPDASGHVEVWTIPAGTNVEIYATEAETKFDRLTSAEFKNWNTITCHATAKPANYTLYGFDKNYFMLKGTAADQAKGKYIIAAGAPDSADFEIKLNYSAHTNLNYVVYSSYQSRPQAPTIATVSFEPLYRTTRFNDYFSYDGELGVKYTSSSTRFRLWAPTSSYVEVRLYETGTTSDYEGGSDSYVSHPMFYRPGGVWELTVSGNLKNKYYTYFINNSSGTNEVMDPYATACGINGKRGMIYDVADTNPTGWDDCPQVWDGVEGYDIKTPQELSIYEVHVRDFTKDSSWVSNNNNKNGTYNAFVEKGTRLANNPSVTTGYDHLNELGIRAVQLLPVFDHDNNEEWKNGEMGDYNWGYNPLNYNCVDGSYTEDPYNGLTRIREYKNLILQMSKTDVHTRVHMDVVYNHVSSASSSIFNKIMPRYFFRYNADGSYSNGSGCSNDFRTESKMGRKFIVDSLVMWASEYKIKGFRFDLMVLIDKDTMKAAKDALYKVDPDIYLYGEAWDGIDSAFDAGAEKTHWTTVYSELYSSENSCYLGAFNDECRNNYRGGNGWGEDKVPEYGYISKGDDVGTLGSGVGYSLTGQRNNGGNPKQTISFFSCHDNFTLFDTLEYCLGATPGKGTRPSISDVAKASSAAHASLMMANSPVLMLGGEELLRTKEITKAWYDETPSKGTPMYGSYISHDSYNAPDATNAFKWGRKVEVDGVNVSEYSAAFASAIQNRNKLKSYDFDYLCNHQYDKNGGSGETPSSEHGRGYPGSVETAWHLVGEGSHWTTSWDYNKGVILYSNPNSATDKGCLLGVHFKVGDKFKVTDGNTWFGYEGVDTWDDPANKGLTCFKGTDDGYHNFECIVEGDYDVYVNKDGKFWIQSASSPKEESEIGYWNTFDGSSAIVFERDGYVIVFGGRNGGTADIRSTTATKVYCNNESGLTWSQGSSTVKVQPWTVVCFQYH